MSEIHDRDAVEGDDCDVESLLRRVADGDRVARERLFEQFRPRLYRMVRSRIGGGKRGEADLSDIVHNALAVAAKRLDDYVAKRPMPFFPWLYVLTRDQMLKMRKKSIGTNRTSLSDQSALRLIAILAASGSTPSEHWRRKELRRKVREAVEQLKSDHSEVLVMRYDEGLKLTEIAAILGVGEGAIRMRHLRAIEEMRRLLGDLGRELSR